MSSKKWKELPLLNTPRYYPGSVLLKSLKAFCFCGSQGKEDLDTIETIETETEG